MSYQVLARKWRPRRFDELVGQAHVVRALTHALDNDRLHHAFLFSGTRGVGKTTIARILAKCLNCEKGVSANPCGECGACVAIDEGRFVDLIEVDAASRTKVDETRELLDNVQYAPTNARYKVYLVDEVHMLSKHSFNALLKTLEEPPPHVKFLLATTDPQRVPVTVLSRCLQFNLKRLPADAIAGQLGHILKAEGVTAEAPAVQRIARAADGSLRDALSLLDQAISYGGGKLEDEELRAMLGTIEQDHVNGLLERLAAGDAQGLMGQVEAIAASGADYAQALDQLLALLHRVAVLQAVPVMQDEEADEAAVGFATALSPEDVQLYYQIGLTGQRDLPLAPDPRLGLEMTLLRMLAFRPVASTQATPGPGGQAVQPAPVARPAAAAAVKSAHDGNGQAAPAAPPAAPAAPDQDWEALLAALKLSGAARELAAHCAWGGRQGHRVTLKLMQADAYLRAEALEGRLQQALEKHFEEPVRLVIALTEESLDTPASRRRQRQDTKQRQAEQALEADPTVRALKEHMGAQVLPGSVRPAED